VGVGVGIGGLQRATGALSSYDPVHRPTPPVPVLVGGREGVAQATHKRTHAHKRTQTHTQTQVVNTQRDKIYAERRRAVLTDNLDALIIEYAERTADEILEANVDANGGRMHARNWSIGRRPRTFTRTHALKHTSKTQASRVKPRRSPMIQ
jgi:hypothetical protein